MLRLYEMTMDLSQKFPYATYVPSEIRFGGGVTEWLSEHIGIGKQDWDYKWIKSEFYFKTEEDKVKFILKWI